MPIRITLSDNEVIEAGISLDQWNQAYRDALAANTMLEIEDPSGRILSINPHRVVLIEVDQPSEQAQTAERTQVAS
jgi:hypothetical protein